LKEIRINGYPHFDEIAGIKDKKKILVANKMDLPFIEFLIAHTLLQN
jgi:hypothetical protein